MAATTKRISKKRKIISEGIFFAELNHFLSKQLSEDGYSGVELRITPQGMEVIIKATRTKSVLGEKGRRIQELTAAVTKRFGFEEGAIKLYAERVAFRGLSAMAQAESFVLASLPFHTNITNPSSQPPLQVARIPPRPPCLLRSHPLRHGSWCQGYWNCHLR